jgi:hypothetical protein
VAAIGTFEDLKRLTGEERLEKVFLSLVEETPVLAR